MTQQRQEPCDPDGLGDLVRRYMAGGGTPAPSVPTIAIVLPHYKNRNQTGNGEWILTAVLDSSGRVLEESDKSLGIYPNKRKADEEITSYLRENGAEPPQLRYVNLPESTWQAVERIQNMPSGEDLVWAIFARSKSNEDVLKYISNVERSFKKTRTRDTVGDKGLKPCTEKRLHDFLQLLHSKDYLRVANLPQSIITHTDGAPPYRPEAQEVAVYDGDQIMAGMANGDSYAFIAEAARGLAEILDNTFGLAVDWCEDRQRFQKLLRGAVSRWKQETLDPQSRIGLISEITDNFDDYAMNIALQVWFLKMRVAHGIAPKWT